MTLRLRALHVRAILLDVEGTTTPIDFVYQVLFPYARQHVAAFFEREWNSAPCREAVALLEREWVAEHPMTTPAPQSASHDADSAGLGQTAAQPFTPGEALAYVGSLMDRDRKSPGLKALQGLVWQDGFRAGQLRGQVYRDVPPAFQRWRGDGLDIFIYSSGSVLAQRLLFGSTEAGDLTTDLTGYFDTEVGPKGAPDSYRRIAQRVALAPSAMLFVSDVVGELDAARTAGMLTALCVRGDQMPEAAVHTLIQTFDDIAN